MTRRATASGGLLFAGLLSSCPALVDSDLKVIDERRRAEAGAESGDSGGSLLCGAPGVPTRLDCPAPCDFCALGTCRIECDREDECKGAELSCPEGLLCAVLCSEKASCADALVTCPELGCSVECVAEDACKEARVVCQGGSCLLACGPEETACEHSALDCGSGKCAAKCGGQAKPPRVDCAAACECELCSD